MVLIDPKELLTEIDLHLNGLDLERQQLEFLRMDAEAYRASTFLDHRIRTASQQPVSVSIPALMPLLGVAEAAKSFYIFHTSFCCSTLLARCMDVHGVTMALKEPLVLMQLANEKRLGRDVAMGTDAWRRLVRLVLWALARPGRQARGVVIKPTNAANNLVEDIAGDPGTSGMVFLYSSLERFLASVIRKGEPCRIFVRKMFNILMMDSERLRNWPPAQLLGMTDLQVAALVWHLQMDHYMQMLQKYPDANIHTLDCDSFLEKPAETLAALFGYLGESLPAGVIQQIVESDIFRSNAKNDVQEYDSAMREDEFQRVKGDYRGTLEAVVSWSWELRPEGPLQLPLPRAVGV